MNPGIGCSGGPIPDMGGMIGSPGGRIPPPMNPGCGGIIPGPTMGLLLKLGIMIGRTKAGGIIPSGEKAGMKGELGMAEKGSCLEAWFVSIIMTWLTTSIISSNRKPVIVKSDSEDGVKGRAAPDAMGRKRDGVWRGSGDGGVVFC